MCFTSDDVMIKASQPDLLALRMTTGASNAVSRVALGAGSLGSQVVFALLPVFPTTQY